MHVWKRALENIGVAPKHHKDKEKYNTGAAVLLNNSEKLSRKGAGPYHIHKAVRAVIDSSKPVPQDKLYTVAEDHTQLQNGWKGRQPRRQRYHPGINLGGAQRKLPPQKKH